VANRPTAEGDAQVRKAVLTQGFDEVLGAEPVCVLAAQLGVDNAPPLGEIFIEVARVEPSPVESGRFSAAIEPLTFAPRQRCPISVCTV